MKIKLKEGDEAPDFEGTGQDGETVSLSDYKGKILLLYFYPKDNTPGCTREACAFRDSYGELSKYVSIVGVSANSEASHEKFINKYDLPFPLIADTGKEIIRAYGADGVFFPRRVSFLINGEGKIEKIYEKVKVDDHANEILDDVTELF